ncbi:hypothetical protein niasHT_013604 [Heterodera trifolii]|uniref:Uncharacterized protein n=1 Tax=Heterodera trifolii TaxID=157864 RepID=A0ABD2LEB6_9BILA
MALPCSPPSPPAFPLLFIFLLSLSSVGTVPLVGSADLVHLPREHQSNQRIQRLKTALNENEAKREVPPGGNAPPPSSSAFPFTSTTLPTTSAPSNTSSDASARLLCQFFIFSTLFGSVCTISACTCLFRTRRSISTQQRRVASMEDASISRLTRIREPFGPDKPYCLKFDEKGLCYASPLTREVPPLPTYEDACKMLSLAEIMANCGESKGRKEQRECIENKGEQQKNEKV